MVKKFNHDSFLNDVFNNFLFFWFRV
jgi:hypothetical protein